jgi:hypothetical protein
LHFQKNVAIINNGYEGFWDMFLVEKVLQEIGYLLSLNDGRMNLLKLMKELYLIDRMSIADRDSSISGDVYFSLPHGPILSLTLNMLSDLRHLNGNNPWLIYLKSEESKYYSDIVLCKKTQDDMLSKRDKKYIEAISNKFKDFGNKEIEDYTHSKLPEWNNPNGSSIKIRFDDIMLALGKTREEILEAKKEYDRINNLSKYLKN